MQRMIFYYIELINHHLSTHHVTPTKCDTGATDLPPDHRTENICVRDHNISLLVRFCGKGCNTNHIDYDLNFASFAGHYKLTLSIESSVLISLKTD